MAGRRRRGTLSAEDRELWSRVADTARPIRRQNAAPPVADASPGRPVAPLAAPPAAPTAAPPAASAGASSSGPARADAHHPERRRIVLRPEGRPYPPVAWRMSPDADRPAPARPGTPGLDRNTARRLAEGRLAPQARLDLHGMTVEAAHGALSRFIHESSALGRRCVLVVTGKGRGEHGGRGAGVLRRDTPRWLTVSPLAEQVVGVFEAHPRHGGGGALYVYIRKRR